MPEQLPLLGRGPITFSSASHKNSNVLNELAYVSAIKKQYRELWSQRESIEALVRHHLGLGSDDTVTVLEPRQWIQGTFNVCVIVEVTSADSSSQIVFRCPKPHRLNGIVDEKVSSEVGTYVWMQEKCPDVRIPHLFGFGFEDGRHYTHVAHRSFFTRLSHMIRRLVNSFFGSSEVLSHYTANNPSVATPSAYLLLEHINPDTGHMLSTTWETHRDDPVRRQNLFQGMSRIILSLAKIPQPKIGAFRFNHDGTISLTNRYLSCSLAILENDGAPRTIQSDEPHTSTDRFVSDMVTFHDGRFLAQPNATFSEKDCRGQMAVLTLLRAISHRYMKREHRDGPFLLQFTDFNPSNFFVDDDWNVTCLMDLEWICALPVEMLNAPHWLTGQSIEAILDEEYVAYDKVREEFMDILKREEEQVSAQHDISVSGIMEEMWKSKGVWFWHCLASVDAMNFLLEDHLCPPDCLSSEVERGVSEFWSEDAGEVVRKKLADKQKYNELLKGRFSEADDVSSVVSISKA